MNPVDHRLAIVGCCKFRDKPTNESQLEGSFGNFRKSAEHVNSTSSSTGISYRLLAFFGFGDPARPAVSAVAVPVAANSEGVVTR